jgi:hypothetical protein
VIAFLVPAVPVVLWVPSLYVKLPVLAVLWVLSLYVIPFGWCLLCGGRGVRIDGRRARKCWLCKGLGRRQRLGSRTVHRIRRQVVTHWRGQR